jgi:hypothetical protein
MFSVSVHGKEFRAQIVPKKADFSESRRFFLGRKSFHPKIGKKRVLRASYQEMSVASSVLVF